jgi:uncharacterized membrane protein
MSSAQANGGSSPPSLSVRLGRAFRRYFVTGLATLFPVVVTIWLVVTIFQFADRQFGRIIGVSFPGLGLVVTLLVILGVGVLSVHFFGRVLFQVVEAWLSRLPFVKKVYPPVKQLAQFLFDEEKRRGAFRRVVLVPYPRAGAYSLAFVTNESRTAVMGTPQTLLTCLIPNPPSPFTGPIIFIPEQDAVPLGMSVEDAVKLIVSGGVVASPLERAGSG